ncbi:MAG: transposase [Rhodobacteraceae bacterium]|nr:transposase [Paracoccaceae bacterium]
MRECKGLRYHNQLDPLPQKSRGRTHRRRPGHNLALRFYHHRDDTLRCLHHPLVPATNNLAERDRRPLKIKQKISGSFRTKAGAREFAVLRSVLETARKRRLNALDILGTNLDELMERFAVKAPAPDT